VLECPIAAGDVVSATVEAEALEAMLRSEDLDPEVATQVSLRDARVRATGHPAPSPDEGTDARDGGLVAELVGREREFATTMNAWAEVNQGHTRRIHLVGPPGFGKTRLLHDVRNRLRSAGGRAVYVRATFGARDIAY